MGNILILLRPRDEMKIFAEKIVEKFKIMQGVSLTILPAKNLNDIARKIEAGQVAILFAECTMQLTESNFLREVFAKSKQKPYIITVEENYQLLLRNISKDLIGKISTEFSEDFMFNCVRNLLTPPGQKIDSRYIQGIVLSVIEVIKLNTQCQITPQPISELESQETVEEITSVLGFCGDGFLGSLTVRTNRALMTIFAQKMLYCEESDVDTAMLIDLVAEFSNQIAGAVRNGLSAYGYRLSTSMQGAVIGENVSHASRSNGLNYNIPFVYEGMKFDVALSYNTYQTSIKELDDEAPHSLKKSLDIRLVNAAIQSILEVCKLQTKEDFRKGRMSKHTGDTHSSSSIHIFHVSNWQGKVILALVVPKETSHGIIGRLKEMEEDEVQGTMINELFGSILTQVGNNFLQITKEYGYSFQKIYQGDLSGQDVKFNLKNPGLFYRQNLYSKNYQFDVIFGTDSAYASEFFDVWPYMQTVEAFNSP